jgi:hypothetical protein
MLLITVQTSGPLTVTFTTVAPVGAGEGDGPIVADGDAVAREVAVEDDVGGVAVRLTVAVMIATATSPTAAAVKHTKMTALRRRLPLMSLSGG